MSDDYNNLTEKQKRFIDYYIETANATESARRAGYKGDNLNRIASENLSKLDKYIKERLNQKESDRIASQDEILEYFTKIMRTEKEDTNDRTRCAELLGKRYGMFKEKVEVETDKPFEVNITIKGKK